ncbi:MAG: protein phosphatase CheZ [bacterium]
MQKIGGNMSEVFSKLNDLKNVFKFGEKIVPIIQSLIEFMKEIVPLIENINTSISESTAQMPKASNQINNVTSQTEMATTEILDMVDSITNQLMEVEAVFSSFAEKEKRSKEIKEIVKQKYGNDIELMGLLKEYLENTDYNSAFNRIKEILAQTNNDIFQITISLQVQDITTQQLAAVNHLIDSVNNKLSGLIKEIDQSDIKEDIKFISIEVPEGSSFDPNAVYDKSEKRQQNVDQIVTDQKQQASQEEIDKLFS